MVDAPAVLHDREKAILRLLLIGHDAKSIARAEGLSLNIVNERLRDARRKLGVTSSREAARLLGEQERNSPNSLGNMKIGIEVNTDPATGGSIPASIERRAHFLEGAWFMPLFIASLAIGAAALAVSSTQEAPRATPKAVRTYPANNAAIPAGPFTLSVTFDQAMRADSFSFVRSGEGVFPECAKTPSVSRDRRTFSLSCVARSGQSYLIWFNRGRYRNFVSESTGIAAIPTVLKFSTR